MDLPGLTSKRNPHMGRTDAMRGGRSDLGRAGFHQAIQTRLVIVLDEFVGANLHAHTSLKLSIFVSNVRLCRHCETF